MTTRQLIDRAAIVMAIGALAFGILMPMVGRMDIGVRLEVVGDRIMVTGVNPYSPAALSAFQPGMVVLQLNNEELIRLPRYVYPEAEPTPDPDTGDYPPVEPIGIEPAEPVFVITDPDQLYARLQQPLYQIGAIAQSQLVSTTPESLGDVSLYDYGWNALRGSVPYVAFGVMLLFAAAWSLGSRRAGRSLQELAYPLALAIAAPALLWPLEASASPVGVALYSVLMPACLLPLAAALVVRIASEHDQRLAAVGIAAFFAATVGVGVARLAGPAGADQALVIALLAGGITALPGIIATGPGRATEPQAGGGPSGPVTAASTIASASTIGAPDRVVTQPPDQVASLPAEREAATSGRVVRGFELGVVGMTPFFAITTVIGPFNFMFPLWLLAVAIASRGTVRPLARLASRAQLQRDLIVAATEAERARVAADIHDDALQELTLLVRRLDAAGDAEGADIARGVSDRLRAICGDLRLPILDDLGVGPALDWLVLRIERLAGGEVRLERSDGTRPPADVELAFFRVAQEALSNAVRHGRPPIVVRYRSADGAASLSIDDAGGGITPDAGDRA
ncbi:MAG: hypothetical protein Q8M74_03240, partial [Chloroflexota bacterium]|nr:hypothetical protein [Chloroflexota bacterium]